MAGLNDVFGNIGLNDLLKVAMTFITIDLATRMLADLRIPGLPKFVPSLITLVVAVARIQAVKPLTKGLPSQIRGFVDFFMKMSTIQIAFAQLPTLLEGIRQTYVPTTAPTVQTDFL